MKEGAKETGRDIKEGAQKAGQDIKDGAQKTGDASQRRCTTKLVTL
jgi:predicted small secreted protein